MKNKFIIKSSIITLSLGLTLASTLPSQASANTIENTENTNQQEQNLTNEVKMQQLDEHTFVLHLGESKVNIDKNGVPTITDIITQEKEILPTETTNQNGDKINIIYEEYQGNLIGQYQKENVNNNSFSQPALMVASNTKCGVGTLASYYAGILSGAGASVGVIGGPAGAVGGAIIGGLTGSYSGAGIGYATFC